MLKFITFEIGASSSRAILGKLEELISKKIEILHFIGGGSSNTLLIICLNTV